MRELLILLCFLCPLSHISAAEVDSIIQKNDTLSHWGGSISLNPGRILALDRVQKKWLKQATVFSMGAELHHAFLPADSNAYDADYGYPVIGLGVKYSLNHNVKMHRNAPDDAWPLIQEVDYDSYMGNSIAFYGFFKRPLFRNRRWEADYIFNFGVGYSHSKYNPNDNIDNELIGSRWLLYFGFGLRMAYQVAPDWSLGLGVDYWHLSNGAINRPNKGANVCGPSLTLSYTPFYESLLKTGPVRRTPFSPYLFVDITGGVGYRTLYEDWKHTQFEIGPDDPDYRIDNFSHYFAYTMQSSLMCRYARRWASGVEADVFYGDYASRLKEYDERAGRDLPHSPWSVGLGVKHEAYYRSLKVSMSFGWYLYREMGHVANRVEKSYYERIGVLYIIPKMNGLALGFSVKAHSAKADYTEMVLSFPLMLGKQTEDGRKY